MIFNHPSWYSQQEEKKEKQPEEKKPEEKEKDSSDVIVEAKELTQFALKAALSVSQQQRLLALLDGDPALVYEIAVTPYQVSPPVDIHVYITLRLKHVKHYFLIPANKKNKHIHIIAARCKQARIALLTPIIRNDVTFFFKLISQTL